MLSLTALMELFQLIAVSTTFSKQLPAKPLEGVLVYGNSFNVSLVVIILLLQVLLLPPILFRLTATGWTNSWFRN